MNLTPIFDTQNIPRPFQHVRQQPLYAVSVDTDSLYTTIPRIPSLETELRESLGHLINDTAMAPRPLGGLTLYLLIL